MPKRVAVTGDALEQVDLQQVDTVAGVGRDGQAPVHRAGLRAATVHLVEDRHDATHVHSEVCQHFLSHVHVLAPLGVAPVNDMKDKVRSDDLFERTAKRRHEMMRELAKEANGVDEDGRRRTSEETLAKLRVEGREKRPLGPNAGACKAVEES